VTLRLRVHGDLLVQYRELERIHRQTLPNTSFIQFICASFWRTWVPSLGVSDKWESIYRRDRYRCTSPVCHQRNVTLHHVQYRARGGTDDPDNLTSPCAFCHLEGEHGGRLKILPPRLRPHLDPRPPPDHARPPPRANPLQLTLANPQVHQRRSQSHLPDRRSRQTRRIT
jgi:hypothetical protein